MITVASAVEGLLYCLIFVAVILLSETVIAYQRIDEAPRQARIKIAIMTATTTVLTLSVYCSHCYGEVGFLECIYINPGEELMKNIGIALFINTSLFLGGLHQWLYVKLKRYRMGKSRGSFWDFTRSSSNGISSRNCSWYFSSHLGSPLRIDRIPCSAEQNHWPELRAYFLFHLLQRYPFQCFSLYQLL